MSDKTEWPEVVDLPWEEAKEKIKKEFPKASVIQEVPDDSMVTMDYRVDRVRIFYNKEGKVSSPPRIG